MKQIASFTIDHDLLEKGMYVSRIDGDVITYDIRMKKEWQHPIWLQKNTEEIENEL